MSIKIAISSLLMLLTSMAFADGTAKPTCTSNVSVGYCQYVGTVREAYANEAGLLLVYYEASMEEGAEDGTNYNGNITHHVAAAFNYKNDPEFGSMLYSTVLAAQARGAIIKIQMRGVHGNTTGYPLIDRIWIVE